MTLENIVVKDLPTLKYHDPRNTQFDAESKNHITLGAAMVATCCAGLELAGSIRNSLLCVEDIQNYSRYMGSETWFRTHVSTVI